MLDQNRTPLFEALSKYANDDVTPFHTPGHKMGKGMHHDLKEMLGTSLKLDLTIMPELDDLHEPHGPIKKAQDLAAELYGADHSYFMVNGTTGGIYAMILAIAGPGDKIIVPRNAHRSTIGGIILSGASPVFVRPEIDTEIGLAMGVSPASIERALNENPDTKGIVVINPTYYGVATDLKAIVDMAHKRSIPVVVDEAHGPHLKFSDQLPIQALDAGADIVAQSTHKLLGAMTQCSLVHCREGLIRVPRLKAMLQLVQSTSPNYILMASIDVARMQMAKYGEELWQKAIELSNYARKQINEIPGLYCFGEEKLGTPGSYSFDPTKITVTVKNLGIKGTEAQDILRHKHKIQVELSDVYNVLFLITIGDSQEDIDKLINALRDIAINHKGNYNFESIAKIYNIKYPMPPAQVILPRDALFGNTIVVPFEDSEGLVCAEIVTFYPPGIPMLCPGEKISKELIDYCNTLKNANLHISGPEDYTLKTIKVVD